jgi:hypothetical protein
MIQWSSAVPKVELFVCSPERREKRMVEKYEKRVHTEHVVLDIGQDIGALIIYTRGDLRGKQIDVSLKENATAKRVHTDVLERTLGGRPVFAAVFAALPAGEYVTWSDPAETFTIVGGGIADMQYTENGQVAWNEMWTSFCDLALAGGPPHRDTLIEPVPPDEVRANMAGYERVLAEIERGLRLVTGMPILHSERLGWIGLKCEDEEMACWLLRAIIVENICVRREASVLFLPVGPEFHLEKEIKNVITVVAKTHQYWIEHRGL